MAKSPWRILGIPAGSDRATIRRAYARLLKKTNPEDDPDGFMALRAAYDAALQQADWREGQGSGPDGAEDDDADAAIPVEPPAAQPTTADPDQAAVDELIARQEALVALLAQQGAGRDELLAAVDHVLTAPLAERIDVRAGLEDWLGRMLVEFRPASDPLVVPVKVVGSTPQMGYVRVSFTFGVLEPAASERLELSILDMVLQQLGR